MLEKSECISSNKSNILTMHRRKLKNHARFMISNEYPPIWNQPRISSSISLEMTIQLRPQRREKKAEKISRMYEIKKMHYAHSIAFPSLRGGLRPYV